MILLIIKSHKRIASRLKPGQVAQIYRGLKKSSESDEWSDSPDCTGILKFLISLFTGNYKVLAK